MKKWKLWTRNQNIQPQHDEAEQFDSKADALRRACETIRNQISLKVQVLYIEGPTGERAMDSAEIAAWCKNQ